MSSHARPSHHRQRRPSRSIRRGRGPGINDDLTDLFVALGEAARDHKTGVIFLLDEIQYLKAEELEALITALHKCARRSLPITLARGLTNRTARIDATARPVPQSILEP
ncbi:MAG: hypothetical protein IPG61_17040 [bacterium]|nr:hypothetical protein [bacterium]